MKKTNLSLIITGLILLTLTGIAENKIRWDEKDPVAEAFRNSFDLFHFYKQPDPYYYFDENNDKEDKSQTREYSSEEYDYAESDSIVREFYDSGRIKSITEYKDSIPHGGLTLYYEDGQVKLESYYVNGKPDGEEIAYYPNGKRKHTKHYKEGKEYGSQRIYNRNGRLTKSYYVDENGEIRE